MNNNKDDETAADWIAAGLHSVAFEIARLNPKNHREDDEMLSMEIANRMAETLSFFSGIRTGLRPATPQDDAGTQG